jgi:hypothetical protein
MQLINVAEDFHAQKFQLYGTVMMDAPKWVFGEAQESGPGLDGLELNMLHDIQNR